jgi:hypothetical protein
MTDKEKAIVMAYTGVCMLAGDKFQIFHKYVEDIMGRPVYTHELANKAVEDEIKEKAKDDFIVLCANESDDAISRKDAIIAMIKIEQDDIERYGCEIPEGFDSSPAIEALINLPSVVTAKVETKAESEK